jgi:hypothetical protein
MTAPEPNHHDALKNQIDNAIEAASKSGLSLSEIEIVLWQKYAEVADNACRERLADSAAEKLMRASTVRSPNGGAA